MGALDGITLPREFGGEAPKEIIIEPDKTKAEALPQEFSSKEKSQKASKEEAPPESAWSMFVKRAARSFGEGVGRWGEAGQAIAGGEQPSLAAFRLLFPRELMDKVSTPSPITEALRQKVDVSPETLGDSATVGVSDAILRQEEASPVIGAPLSVMGSITGTIGDFMGAGASLPIGPMGSVVKTAPKLPQMGREIAKELARDAGFNMGVGTAAATVREGTENVARAMGADEGTQKKIGVGGELVGGILGGMRHSAATAAWDATKAGARKGKEAIQAATGVVTKRKGDERAMEEIFKERFEMLDADAQGMVQKQVLKMLAGELYKDIHAKESLAQFDELAKSLGMTPEEIANIHITQRALTPSLLGTITEMRVVKPEDVAVVEKGFEASKQTAINVAKRVLSQNVDASTKGIVVQMNKLRDAELDKIRAFSEQADDYVAKNVAPELTVDALKAQGERVRTAFERDVRQAVDTGQDSLKNRYFNEANALADQVGVKFDTSKAVEETKDILKTTMAQINKETVPESLRKFATLFLSRRDSADSILSGLDQSQLSAESRQWLQNNYGAQTARPVSLRDVNDVLVTLHKDMAAAARGTDQASRMEFTNLKTVETALRKIIQEQAPENVKQAHNKAVDYFRTVVVPATREGKNLGLSRDATAISQAGRDAVIDENVIRSYLKDPQTNFVTETSMREFDNAFRGNLEGTKRVEVAYEELSRTLQSDYRQQVLKTGSEGFKPEAHEAFLKKYDAALKRTPGLKEKLDSVADTIEGLNFQKKLVEDRYEKLAGKGTLMARFGDETAKDLLKKALADPRKMGQLLHLFPTEEGAKALYREVMLKAAPFRLSGGRVELDNAKLKALLDSGRAGTEGGVGGLQVLLRAALGKKEGDAQLERLNYLLNLGQRIELSRPRHLRPDNPLPDDIIKEASGSTIAGMTSMGRSLAENRIGLTYFASYFGGRAFNQQLREKFNKAYIDGLYNPKLTQALIDLSANKPVTKSMWQTIFGTGEQVTKYFQYLQEKGLLGGKIANAARLTATVSANRKEDRPEEKVYSPSNPLIIDIKTKAKGKGDGK